MNSTIEEFVYQLLTTECGEVTLYIVYATFSIHHAIYIISFILRNLMLTNVVCLWYNTGGSVWQGLVRYATKKKKSSRCIFHSCRASAAGVLPLQGRTASTLSPYNFTTNTGTNIKTQIQIQLQIQIQVHLFQPCRVLLPSSSLTRHRFGL